MDGTKLGPGQVLCSSTSKTYILLILRLCSLGDWREDGDCRTLSDPDRIASFVGWQENDELESFWKKSSSERAINPSQRPLPTQHPVISGNEYDAITRIRNNDPSYWEVADLHLAAQGHRDLLTLKLPKPNSVTLKKEILSCFENQKEQNPKCGNNFKTSATKTCMLRNSIQNLWLERVPYRVLNIFTRWEKLLKGITNVRLTHSLSNCKE